MEDFFSAASLGAEFDFVGDQARLEFDRKGIGLINTGLLGFGFDQFVGGIELEEDALGGIVKDAVVIKRAFVGVVAGIELVVGWLLILFRRVLHPGILRRFTNYDLHRLSDQFTAIADRHRDRQRAAVACAIEDELPWFNGLHFQQRREGPLISQLTAALGLESR